MSHSPPMCLLCFVAETTAEQSRGAQPGQSAIQCVRPTSLTSLTSPTSPTSPIPQIDTSHSKRVPLFWIAEPRRRNN